MKSAFSAALLLGEQEDRRGQGGQHQEVEHPVDGDQPQDVPVAQRPARSGRPISSRRRRVPTAGRPGGLSASHESHRRHRYQRSPPDSRENRYPPARSAAASVPEQLMAVQPAADQLIPQPGKVPAEAVPCRAPPAAPPDCHCSPSVTTLRPRRETASPPRLQTSAARPEFLSRARRLRSSPARLARAAAQSGPVFAQAPDPVRVPGQGGAAGQQPGGVPRHLRCALRLLRRRQYPQGLSGIRHGRWQPPDRRVQGRCPGTRGVSHGCGQEGQARGKVNKG